jgi:hypothetical protein
MMDRTFASEMRMQRQSTKSETAKTKPVSHRKKPEGMELVAWQRALRAHISETGPTLNVSYIAGEHPVYGDYSVHNPATGGTYKVALRSREPGPNFCSCLDFKTSGLGTCKHIEAVLQSLAKNKRTAKLLLDEYRPAYSSLTLIYGGREREVQLRIGTLERGAFEKLARGYFDPTTRLLLPHAYDRVERFLAEAGRISPDFRCYDDAMDFILAQRERLSRGALVARKLKGRYFSRLLKTKLYPFQQAGIEFAVRAGRCLIADEMGLGKTVQAIGAAEVFRKETGATRALIVCPTSLKYQWKSEIEKFTNETALVVEGDAAARRAQYESERFYTIASYSVVGADREHIEKMKPDVIILDEAQRIKNWGTKTSREVKKIASPHAIVLTGTPIENKLEELYSIIIIQFIVAVCGSARPRGQ